MNKTGRRTGLADALFTPVQQKVLALLFGQPNRRFRSAELISLAASGTGAVHRQLDRLAGNGLVTVTWIGNQKHYQANRQSPVFRELHGLITKTVGVVEPIRRALASLAANIVAAFVYGSLAKGTDRAESDIDLMVVSDSVQYSDLYGALQTVEKILGRTLNPTLLTVADWKKKRTEADSFVSRVSSQARLMVIGAASDLD